LNYEELKGIKNSWAWVSESDSMRGQPSAGHWSLGRFRWTSMQVGTGGLTWLSESHWAKKGVCVWAASIGCQSSGRLKEVFFCTECDCFLKDLIFYLYAS
jgi:hypothetical protein